MAGLHILSLLTRSKVHIGVFFAILLPQTALSSRCPKQADFVFRDGDTLSEVLWFLGSEPVYGKRGWIERTWKINPQLLQLRGKEIPPGTRMKIPLKSCPLSGGWTLQNGELIAPYHHRKTASDAANQPTVTPTAVPSPQPKPTAQPTVTPTAVPTPQPTPKPTAQPTVTPTAVPTPQPIAQPTVTPTAVPTPQPTAQPTESPTAVPTPSPTQGATPKATTTPASGPKKKLQPIENMRKNIKESKEAFDKSQSKEQQFLEKLKSDDDFSIQSP